jgi:2-succinyl-5-enolpyruvyl-6-hydroxy-3-cyclohexene-1-carboxylate synthase
VHLNLPFREPLLGEPGPLPPARQATELTEGWTWRPPSQTPTDPVIAAEDLAGQRGIVVAGRWSGRGDLVHEVAAGLGWPVLADPLSQARRPGPATIAHADVILRSELAGAALQPQIVLRLGEPPASRIVNEWLAATGVLEVVVAGGGRWSDPSGTAGVVLDLDPADYLGALQPQLVGVEPTESGWLDAWRAADDAAAGAIESVLAGASGSSEPGTARALVAALPEEAALVVSSSMPIRDVEWYASPRQGLRVVANRGANGIDGVISTGIGVAVGTGGPTAVLVGDLAFLHDSNGLLGVTSRRADCVIVVSDNDGGGIFSFLAQAEAVDPARFEQLFGTPHGLDLVAVASALGVEARATADVSADVKAALARGGVHVLVVRTDRSDNLELHRQINAAGVQAVEHALEP